MKTAKHMYFILGMLFLCVGASLAARIYSLRPVIFLGQGLLGSYFERIMKTLNESNPNSSFAPEGLEAPLLDLRVDSNATMRIIVIEGIFTDTEIQPKQLWQKYLHAHNYVLVNSVDEKQDIAVSPNSLAGHIGAGCKLDGYVGQLLNIGEVRSHPCVNGSYVKSFGEGEVANAAIILFDETNPNRPPCWKTPNEFQYRDCINEAVNDSLLHIFGPDHSSDLDAPVLVMPALGTGFGKLTKNDFYKDLRDSLGNRLSHRKSNLQLLLLVNRQTNDWKVVKEAIAKQIGELADSWHERGQEVNSADLWFMCGISFVMSSVFIVVASTNASRTKCFPEFLRSLSPLTVAIGWFSAAAGVMTILKQAAALLFPQLPGEVYGLAGLLAPFVCISILKAIVLFEAANRTLPESTIHPQF